MAIISRRLWRAQERRRKIMTGAARSGPDVRLIKLKHGQTRYRLEGDASAPLLICIHGWSTASYVWDQLRPDLVAKGYRVLTYDLYGRGMSDRPDMPHTIELFTGQLSALLTELGIDNTPTSVIGYSMGGAIAARFVCARRATIDRMLLIAPAGMAVQLPFLRRMARAVPRLVDPHILALMPQLLPRQFDAAAAGFEHIPAVARVVRNQKRELAYRGYVTALLSSLKEALAVEMESEHKRIATSEVKVKALFAAQDDTIPMRRALPLFAGWNPRAGIEVISEAGHGLPYTHPSGVITAMGDFLDRPAR